MKKIIAGALVAATALIAAPAASAATHVEIPGVPSRTSITVDSPWVHASTANSHESRPGLSTVKLYIADYALNHGDGSPHDVFLAERAIRYSDDNAAQELYNKYPNSISSTAANYGLSGTHGAAHWGNSTTSTDDTAKFLEAKKANQPTSPVLHWMNTAAPVAADGTHQNWGTAHVPGTTGTKWGWSDYGPSVVASASIAPGFSVAANTHGTPADQNHDVQSAQLEQYPAPKVNVTGSVEQLSSSLMTAESLEMQSLRSAVEEKVPATPEVQAVVEAIPGHVMVPKFLTELVPNVQ